MFKPILILFTSLIVLAGFQRFNALLFEWRCNIFEGHMVTGNYNEITTMATKFI